MNPLKTLNKKQLEETRDLLSSIDAKTEEEVALVRVCHQLLNVVQEQDSVIEAFSEMWRFDRKRSIWLGS